eukprot:CAMPEP_0202000288 /NCGR_PEP_ID=MMETSP0905-20130828/6665_1 /ASSEMBLY_ACC=CAM_ASM_000554 /TAXON_ID=420261 /ORGANISM="Thalassiosira antarctica, Strain CCMP982" /LENGTH=49 /DNA_ID= /DNA_START= /DNA_END= /DNA_ORIENTATION=
MIDAPLRIVLTLHSGKGAYGRWWAMVDVVGRWMRVGVRGGWKMDDGGRT